MSEHPASTPPECAIYVAGLRKTYGTVEALAGVSFIVRPGEMVALLGPSGSGKSTLLRCISGLVKADRRDGGIVQIAQDVVQKHGRLPWGVRKTRARLGFVFQHFNLVPRLGVLTNVLAGAIGRMFWLRSALRLFTRNEKREAMRQLQRVGIAEHAAKRASELSGGQQQRAAIARALMQGAETILADEPIASLDPQSAHLVMKILRDINRQDGVTVVVSLHQVEFALHYCDRIIALKDGAISYDGDAANCSTDTLKAIYGGDFASMHHEPAHGDAAATAAQRDETEDIRREAEAL